VGLATAVAGGRKVSSKVYAGILFVGTALLITDVITAWPADFSWLTPDLQLVMVPLASRIDSLSSLFLILLGTATAIVAVYSPGYLERLGSKHGYHVGLYWAATFCFVIAMSEAVLSANAICFLLFWEIVSMATAALLLSQHQQLKSRKAALIYMTASALSAAFMVGGFLTFYLSSGSWYFADWRLSSDAPGCRNHDFCRCGD
jgi:formate hydrogenlyase subunit 3/multisubunit Na+/H+ antiporter MnhD subunit